MTWLHPVALATAFILNGYISFAVHPGAIARAAAFGILGALLVTVAAAAISGSLARGSIAASFGLALVASWVPAGVAAAALAVVAIGLRLLASRRPGFGWDRLGAKLTGFSVVLVGVILAPWLFSGGPQVVADDLLAPPTAATDHDLATLPDIYLVLLDGRARSDWMRSTFGYDDTTFTRSLKDRGFTIYPSATSNYDSTAWTLASLFGMAYLDEIPSLQGVAAGEEPLQPRLRQSLGRSTSINALRSDGYEIVAVSAGWNELTIRTGSRFIDCGSLNETEISLLYSTSLGGAAQDVFPDLLGSQLRSRISCNFKVLADLTSESVDRPRLAFVHIPSPHYPIVYGEAGEPIAVRYSTLFQYTSNPGEPGVVARAYGTQARHVDGMLLDALDAMAPTTTRPRIVIVFSDHGSLTDLGGDQERLSSFLAVHADSDLRLSSHPTPVNLLRRVLSAELGLALPDLPNRSFRTIDADDLIFREVERGSWVDP